MIREACKVASLAAALAVGWVLPAQGAVTAGHSGWQWANPLPQGHTIRAVALHGAVGYAAGDFGTVLRTDDAGSAWSGLATGSTADLDRLAVIDDDSIVVAGECSARRSDDGGRTFVRLPWTASDARCGSAIAGLSFPTDRRGYLMLADGSMLRSDDGGSTWSPTAAVPSPQPTDIAFISSDTGLVTTAGGLVFRTATGGASWTLVAHASHGLRGLDFTDAQIGHAVGEGASVLATSDGGKTWLEDGGDSPLTLTSIRCENASACLATTDNGDRVLRTTDGGRTFERVATTSNILCLAFGPGARALGAGISGQISVTDDAGATWTPVGGRLSAGLIRLRATSQALAFATGSSGRLARTEDGGRTWAVRHVATSQSITDVSFASATTGYALDLVGRLLRTADGGSSWRFVRTGFSARPQAVLARGGGIVLLIGPHGILRSSSSGRKFARVRSRAAQRAKLFEVDHAGRAIVAYGSRRIAMSRNRGRSWRTVRRPPRALIAGVDFVSRRTGFLLEQNGRLWRTRNGGRSWRDLPGIGSDDAVGLAFAGARRGYLVLSRFGDDARGYLLRTSDGGRTWRPQLVTSVPLAAAGIAARGHTGLALAIDGSLFFTRSGGDAGTPSRIRLATPRGHLRGRRTIHVTGAARGAAAGTAVLVGRRLRGESGWDHQLATVTPSGTFATTWRMTRTATFVGQWIGDDDQAGDGTPGLRVTVRRR
jgi:photosystem II stability/assembly factor-like uncharacterized protein